MLCSKCSEYVRPVVAVDIDGTLGDYHAHLLSFAEKYWQRPFLGTCNWGGKGDMGEVMGLTESAWRDMKLAYRQGGQKRSMPVFDGAKRLIDSLLQAGCEVWIATTRPFNRLDSVDPDTQFWLHMNKLMFDFLLYGDNKYEQLHAAVDVDRVVAVIDDLDPLLYRAWQLFPKAITIQHGTRWNRHVQWHSRGDLSQINYQVLEAVEAWKESHGSR